MNKLKSDGGCHRHCKGAFSKKIEIRKTLTKIALIVSMLTTAVTAPAEWVRGYFRSNGTYVAPYHRSSSRSFSGTSGYASSSRSYVYRNPFAAYPSVNVNGYTCSSGTYVQPHVRTPANNTLTDNLSYRGFGTVRVPRNSNFYRFGNSYGGSFSSTTSSFGNRSFTTPYRW